jgi:arylsulfatase
MQGISLRPAFEGKPLSRPTPIFWEHEGNKAVRDGKWKLVQRHKLPWELYDMEADRTERRNLVQAQPEIAARLQTAWNEWASRTYVDDWPGREHNYWGGEIKEKRK